MSFDYQSEKQSLEHRAEAYLRSRGWRYTSSTPCCYWMWIITMPEYAATKDIPAGSLIVCGGTDLAIAIQERMDAVKRLKDGDDGESLAVGHAPLDDDE